MRTIRRVLLCVLLVAGLLGRSAVAHAGYGVQPADGSTVGPSPSFLVYLDSSDSIPIVYVATSPQMTSIGFPTQEIASCDPTTPFAEANKFSCQPAGYSPSYSSSLAPGTYYWWMTFLRQDPGQLYATIHISGPFRFLVVQPTAPNGLDLLSPADGATVSATPRLQVDAPAGVDMHWYVSSDSGRNSDGIPILGADASCAGTTDSAGVWYCDVPADALVDGETYYWWVVATSNGASFLYGPRSFTVEVRSGVAGGASGSGASAGSTSSVGSSGAGGTTKPPPKSLYAAPSLPSSAHFTGASIKQVVLSQVSYALSKALGKPKTIAVACWSSRDWANISGDNPESGYTTLAFYMPAMPHWLDLSPGICRTMETLIYHRPRYTNPITANAVDTLTHETIHAYGVKSEAVTECFAMQLDWITGLALKMPLKYALNLDHLTLQNYPNHPPSYVNYRNCREGGAWDLSPNTPSPPWHVPAL